MRTFEEFSYLLNLQPEINEAARLMVEADIDPEEYLTVFLEDWAGTRSNLGSAWRHTGSAMGDTLQGLYQAGHGIYKSGLGAGMASRAKQVGQGVQGVWKQFFGTEAKMQKAAGLLQRVALDQRLTKVASPTGSGTVLDLIRSIISDLTAAVNSLKGTP